MELYENAIEEKQDEKKNTKPESSYRIATVTGMFEDGFNPKLTFTGEVTESKKKYGYLYSYIPAIGDVVLLAKTESTYIILGKYAYDIAPEAPLKTWTEEEIKEFAEEQIGKHSYAELDRYGTINITTTSGVNVLNYLRCIRLYHTGTVGFCGADPRGAYSIASLSTSADLSTVITKVNSIITALKSFGLFS